MHPAPNLAVSSDVLVYTEDRAAQNGRDGIVTSDVFRMKQKQAAEAEEMQYREHKQNI